MVLTYSERAELCSVDYCNDKGRTKGYCGRHYTSSWRNDNPVIADVDVSLTTPKPDHFVCSKCKEIKDSSSFFVRTRNGIERRDKACRQCISKQSIDYRKNRAPEHVLEKMASRAKVRNVLKLYGEDGLAIRERMDAGDPCEVCKGRTTRMAIDHHHASGKVRGLLCSSCNTVLGLDQEDVDRLQALIQYLEIHKEQ